MRYLLLFLLIAVQTTVLGYTNTSQQENNAQKILTSEKSDLNARSYHFYRYYSPESGTYVSQDPIGLLGKMANLYAYIYDSNVKVDPLGLTGITGLVLAGNATAPGPLRTPQDVVPNSEGIIKGQSGIGEVHGKSAFDTPNNMSNVLSGTKVHEITSADLPEGLAVKADGRNVPGGTRAKGHHTIYNTRDMTFEEFKSKVAELESKKIGLIDKKGNYTCY